jgi:hypothetical protein
MSDAYRDVHNYKGALRYLEDHIMFLRDHKKQPVSV